MVLVTLIFPKAAARLSLLTSFRERMLLVILLFKWLNCLCPACGLCQSRPSGRDRWVPLLPCPQREGH